MDLLPAGCDFHGKTSGHSGSAGNLFGRSINSGCAFFEFDHQQSAGVVRDARIGIVLHHLQGLAIHEFQRGRGDGLGHDGGYCSGCCSDVRIDRLQRASGFGQGGKLEGGFGNDRQCAFRANEQSCQVIAHHALGGAYPRVDKFAPACDGGQSQSILAAGAVLDRPGTSRIAGEVAAHGTYGGAGGIRRPEKSPLGSGLLQLLIGHPRLHPCQAIVGVDFQDAVHALEGQGDAFGRRNGGTRGARATASTGEGQPPFIAISHQLLDLLLIPRKGHGRGQGLPLAVIIAVCQGVGRVREQILRWEERLQNFQLRWGHW